MTHDHLSEPRPAASRHVTALVVGAGPSGSAAAITLARAGVDTLVLEKAQFPRFHIGESLLPYSSQVLAELGLLDEVEGAGFVDKHGADFVYTDGPARRVAFAALADPMRTASFQVDRERFDSILAEGATRAGAELLHGAEVVEVLLDDDQRARGARYRHQGEEVLVTADFVIDAAGRHSRIVHALGLRRPVERIRHVAVYEHRDGFDEQHNPRFHGDVTVGGHPDGWLWVIPVGPGRVSVGSVMTVEAFRAGDPHDLLEEHARRVPLVQQRLVGTTRPASVQVETDYNYRATRVAGPGWFLPGDSGCFGDPIFSGGVFLALTTGREAARCVLAVLGGGDAGAEEERFERFFKTGYDTYARLIYAYYESGYDLGGRLRSLGVDPSSVWFTRILSGDFWTEENPVSQALRANRDWDTFEDGFEPLYGCPVYPGTETVTRAVPPKEVQPA